MKSSFKKYMMYIIPAMCTGIMLTMYLLLNSGKENITRLMDEALKESIDIDFHRRNNKEMKIVNNPLSQKLKRMRIMGEKGPEIIEFKDSIEEYQADQLVAQYILTQIRPVVPDDFNMIFKDELKKQGITCHTGIIYQHNGKTQYSGQDSITYKKAIMTPPATLDIKSTVKIQAWVNCDRVTLLSHSNKKILGTVVFFFIVSAFILFYKGKKKEVPESDPSFTQSIRIDEVQQKIYINGKECLITKTGFLILALLVREAKHFVTREQIAQALWPEEKETVDIILLNNRIDGHINVLRKALSDFPEYKLTTEKGKGYRLVLPLPATEN